MSRPPKPLAEHVQHGTYRADRHGRNHPEPVGDIGDPPSDLPVEGMRYWRDVAASLGKTLGQSDRAILEAASRWWAILVRESRVYEDRRDDRARARAIQTIAAASKAFIGFASRLGASPLDRQRLRGAPDERREDELDSLRRETA